MILKNIKILEVDKPSKLTGRTYTSFTIKKAIKDKKELFVYIYKSHGYKNVNLNDDVVATANNLRVNNGWLIGDIKILFSKETKVVRNVIIEKKISLKDKAKLAFFHLSNKELLLKYISEYGMKNIRVSTVGKGFVVYDDNGNRFVNEFDLKGLHFSLNYELELMLFKD